MEAGTSVPPSGSRLEEKVKIVLQEVLQQEHVIASLPVNEDSLLKLLAPAPLPAPEPDGEKREERWQVGASISPLYNYRDVTSQDGLPEGADQQFGVGQADLCRGCAGHI